jgi:nitrite reductase/ring-hydroxylating ferredoxin subunit
VPLRREVTGPGSVTYHRKVVGRSAQQDVTVLEFPPALQAAGTRGAPYEPVAELSELGAGGMRRVTRGDLDILLAHTDRGIVAVDDRCPHMSAPLSLGALDGCIVDCPLHSGRFDLATGGTVQFPTTGGLDANGNYHPPWTLPGRDPRPEPTDLKAKARALTRIRRLRYYPVRVSGGRIEVAFPV